MNESLKKELWKRWGYPDYPAEWDGRTGAGGKGSQRFWEYLWVIDQMQSVLDLDRPYPFSFIDIGGGDNQFFAKLIRSCNHGCYVVDPGIETGVYSHQSTIEDFVAKPLFRIDDLIPVCISVLEHVEDKSAFCRALDLFPAPIFMTLEFGPGAIENKELYACLWEFKRHYVSKMESCPVIADNSSAQNWRPLGITLLPLSL